VLVALLVDHVEADCAHQPAPASNREQSTAIRDGRAWAHLDSGNLTKPGAARTPVVRRTAGPANEKRATAPCLPNPQQKPPQCEQNVGWRKKVAWPARRQRSVLAANSDQHAQKYRGKDAGRTDVQHSGDPGQRGSSCASWHRAGPGPLWTPQRRARLRAASRGCEPRSGILGCACCLPHAPALVRRHSSCSLTRPQGSSSNCAHRVRLEWVCVCRAPLPKQRRAHPEAMVAGFAFDQVAERGLPAGQKGAFTNQRLACAGQASGEWVWVYVCVWRGRGATSFLPTTPTHLGHGDHLEVLRPPGGGFEGF
jgi:hypothetical protein